MTLLEQVNQLEEVKRWFAQIGFQAVSLIEVMQTALEAHELWEKAEREHLGSFHQRMELCNYAEWLTRKALAAVRGQQFEEEYEGVPRIILEPFEKVRP